MATRSLKPETVDRREQRLQAMRDRYARNREAEKAKRRAWYAANKDRHRAAGKAWAEANVERNREYHAQYYLEHRPAPTRQPGRSPEEARAARRAQQPAHQENRRRLQAARRARKQGRFVEHVDPLVVLERDDGCCGICGGDVDPRDFHMDHILALAAGGEHSYANIQTAHPDCNIRKGWRS